MTKTELQSDWNKIVNMSAISFIRNYEIETDETEFVGVVTEEFDNKCTNIICDYMSIFGLSFEDANQELSDNTIWK